MEKLEGLSHLFVTVFLSSFATVVVLPGITDVTMSALCPGLEQCSLAIYLTGFQQAITGVGTVLMVPLIDNISEGRRASAFGIVSGVISSSFVGATFAARFLSTAQTFQVAAIVSMFALVYMRIFLKDTKCDTDSDSLKQPILTCAEETTQSDWDSSGKIEVFKKTPSLKDLLSLLNTSKTFSQAAFVAFFYTLAEGGLQGSALYFFKARFHFNKDQYADLMLIMGIVGTISQLLFMPMLAPVVGEEKLLSVALVAAFLSMLLNSIAWTFWVPYVITVFGLFSFFATPCLRSIVSKLVGPNEQGTAQGCISGISSFANIISPLVFSPLTDLFLSNRAPFYFPGFSILCAGLLSMIAFIPSLMIRALPPTSSNKVSCDDCEEAEV